MATLAKLNQHLFEQIGRLANADPDRIADEVKRSDAMCNLTAQIIDSAKTQTSMVKLAADHGFVDRDQIPSLLGSGGDPGHKLLADGKGGANGNGARNR
ncbi:MAG: hypothetical protein OXG35_22325 [Acidobacteria bacterium]|nr:hypothetical protein [Acidobacteriota bacterium]